MFELFSLECPYCEEPTFNEKPDLEEFNVDRVVMSTSCETCGRTVWIDYSEKEVKIYTEEHYFELFQVDPIDHSVEARDANRFQP